MTYKTVAPKGRQEVDSAALIFRSIFVAPLAGRAKFFGGFQGRRASRLPLATVFRAFGAVVLCPPRGCYSSLFLIALLTVFLSAASTLSQSGRQKEPKPA